MALLQTCALALGFVVFASASQAAHVGEGICASGSECETEDATSMMQVLRPRQARDARGFFSAPMMLAAGLMVSSGLFMYVALCQSSSPPTVGLTKIDEVSFIQGSTFLRRRVRRSSNSDAESQPGVSITQAQNDLGRLAAKTVYSSNGFSASSLASYFKRILKGASQSLSNIPEKLLGLVVLIFLLVALMPFLTRAAQFVTFLPLTGNADCDLLKTGFINQGFSFYNDSILLVPGNKDQFGGPEFGGTLLYVNAAPGARPTVAEMEIVNFPSDTNFNPQSGYFLPDQSLYYVNNHAFGKGGEQIVVFKITSDLKAQYLMSFTSPLFPFGGLNSMAVLDRNTVFVTLSFDNNFNGSTQEDVFIQIGLDFFARGTVSELLLLCSLDPWSGAADCGVPPGVTEGFSYANGIEFEGPEQTTLFVNDLFKRKIRTFKIDRPASGQVSLVETAGLTPPGAVKEIVRRGDKLSIGLQIPNDGAATFSPDAAQPDRGEFSVGVVQGLLPALFGSLSTDKNLFGISGAVSVNGNYLLGSAFQEGILVCAATS